MIAELDAVVAHLYGLTEKQLVHLFETFHEGWDHEPRLKAVMKYFRAQAKSQIIPRGREMPHDLFQNTMA